MARFHPEAMTSSDTPQGFFRLFFSNRKEKVEHSHSLA